MVGFVEQIAICWASDNLRQIKQSIQTAMEPSRISFDVRATELCRGWTHIVLEAALGAQLRGAF